MGLLTLGTPLSWPETKKHADFVRKHGIAQFLAQYRKLQARKKDVLYWGDEVEYQLVKFDHANRKVCVALRAQEVLAGLEAKVAEKPDTSAKTSWHPEYAEYMVEGTPGKPYGGTFAHFNVVEANMALRRQEIQAELKQDEAPLSLTVFPRLGCGLFTYPPTLPDPVNGVSRSLFFPDAAINQGHIRFKPSKTPEFACCDVRGIGPNVLYICKTRAPIQPSDCLFIVKNTDREYQKQKRRESGDKYSKDINTPSPFIEDFSHLNDDGSSTATAKPDHIYMDCMGFGMGNCCLQVTFQACNIDEAKTLYDQLAGMCPIMLALSASAPIYRGYLSDIDTRWPVISASVDDRTEEERGLKPLKNDRYVIKKSRYDSIDSYISPLGRCYNDIDLTLDDDLCKELIDGGVDELLSRHIAHLFIRDPVSLFSEKIVNQDDEQDTDHFENIQSTNWQTMRFKPPPPNSNIGWRVEFRPMEAQITDFENAAFTVFIVLLTRVILSYKLNFIIPISKVDENMKTAFKRDAVISEKFYFRKDVLTESTPPECAEQCGGLAGCSDVEGEYELMTIKEIFYGKGDFPGLLALINLYMDSMEIDVDSRCTITQYLMLIGQRASGALQTSAKWMRNFVLNHKDYKRDSVVSEPIAYDLLKRIVNISNGSENADPQHLFHHTTKSSNSIPEAMYKAEAFLDQKLRQTTASEEDRSYSETVSNGLVNGE